MPVPIPYDGNNTPNPNQIHKLNKAFGAGEPVTVVSVEPVPFVDEEKHSNRIMDNIVKSPPTKPPPSPSPSPPLPPSPPITVTKSTRQKKSLKSSKRKLRALHKRYRKRAKEIQSIRKPSVEEMLEWLIIRRLQKTSYDE